MANKRKSVEEKCVSKSISLPGWMHSEINRVHDLTGETESDYVRNVLESHFNDKMTLEGQIRWRDELVVRRDRLNAEIDRLNVNITNAQEVARQHDAQIEKVTEIRKLPEYQAAVLKVADSFIAMERSRIINERNKTVKAEPVALQYGISVEFVISDAEIQAEVLKKRPASARISPARKFCA
jgi:hypothetical protein